MRRKTNENCSNSSIGNSQVRHLLFLHTPTLHYFSHFSGITLIAVPADVYKYGAFYGLTCLSAVLLVIASMYVYYPVLFKGDYSSIYEYLEVRFNRKIRLLSSFLYILYENLLLPVVVYTPALALSVGR